MRPHRAVRRPQGEEGFTLVAVVGTMAVLTTLLLGTLGYAVANLAPSRADQNSKSAVAAAEAGIDDYVARLNANNTYFTNGNVDNTNPAFSAPGAVVSGSGSANERYTYRVVDTALVASTGIVRLVSTGQAGVNGHVVSRTLTASLQPRGFFHYVYFTDHEDEDPAFYDKNRFTRNNDGTFTAVPQATVDSMCGTKYYWQGRDESSNYYEVATTGGSPIATPLGLCDDVPFISGDTIDGPLHTNDALRILGSPTFADPDTESAWPATGTPAPSPANQLWWGQSSPPQGYRPYNPGVQNADGSPSSNPGSGQIGLPTSNASLKSIAKSSGCYYTGATKITFSGSQMTVLSPNSTTSDTAASCINKASPGTATTVTTPQVIYVDASAAGSNAVGVGYPLANESLSDPAAAVVDYTPSRGTAYVSGTFTGRTTISADSDIVVTGDLKYTTNTHNNDPAGVTDTIGLIANNNVWVYHPVDNSGNNMLASPVYNIDAGIVALNHSFLVENWDRGALLSNPSNVNTSLTVFGSIVQKFRGRVFNSGPANNQYSGYLKNYVFDSRLQNVPPPYALTPTSAPWIVSQLTDG